MAESYTRAVDDICRLLFVYLTTGETEDILLDWLGAVYTSSAFGEQIVVAMASQLSYPDEISNGLSQCALCSAQRNVQVKHQYHPGNQRRGGHTKEPLRCVSGMISLLIT
jgi:hypothetical protein